MIGKGKKKSVKDVAVTGPDITGLGRGARIRSLRQSRGLSLQQLSDASGVSIGMISSLERDLLPPSMHSLTQLAQALRVPLGWLFEQTVDEREPPDGIVLHRDRGLKIDFGNGITKKLLNPEISGNLELLLVVLEPYSTSGPESYAHGGEEGGYVVKGQLLIWVDGVEYRMNAGDSFHFQSSRSHRFLNPGATETHVIWAITPPLYQGYGDDFFTPQ